jgi:hypothetical protein
MFTTDHTKYLEARLAETEAVTRGWGELLDHAVPRLPDVIVTALREQYNAAEEISEGWRSLGRYAIDGQTSTRRHDPAEAERNAETWHLSESGGPPVDGSGMDRYATGAQLPAPSPGDTLVAPAGPPVGGEPWQDSWFKQSLTPVTDPAPTAVMPALTAGQAEKVVAQVAADARADSAARRLHEADDRVEDGPQHRAPRPGRDPYAQDGGQA